MAHNEAKMEIKRLRQYRLLRSWCGGVVLVVLTLFIGIALARDQARHYRVAVLTPGLSYTFQCWRASRTGWNGWDMYQARTSPWWWKIHMAQYLTLPNVRRGSRRRNRNVLVTVRSPQHHGSETGNNQYPHRLYRVGDTVHYGMIASYASSQNNLTGVSTYSGPLAGKRLELLQEIAPGVKRILAVVAANEKNAELSFERLATAAQKLEDPGTTARWPSSLLACPIPQC